MEKRTELSALETHVRRLLWHQLCFLDIRTCEAQGPNPSIRREDYDTKFPLNCPDEDFLGASSLAPASREHWTPALLQIIRFELTALMRIIWTERRKLALRRRKVLRMLWTKSKNIWTRSQKKYKHLFDDCDPISGTRGQSCICSMRRLIVMVLHPYHHNVANPMGARMRSSLILSGIGIIESACQLETIPCFQDWAWYIGAYQQFQVALLLATEAHEHPETKLLERIWPCQTMSSGFLQASPRDE